jgi:hypothetical protein
MNLALRQALNDFELAGEVKCSQKIECLLKFRGEQKAAPRRKLADEEFEDGCVGLTMIQIGLDHVQMIQVCEQRTGQWAAPARAGVRGLDA